MKGIKSQSGGGIGNGWLNRWAVYALGIALFVSPAGSIASAQTALTQQQYLQSMANLCGDALPASATGADFIKWAQGKGMNPTAGWNLKAKLTKEVMAQTLVQLLDLPPGKGNSDALRILEREGISIPTSGGYVTAKNFMRVINDGVICPPRPNHGGGDDDDDDGGGGGNGRGDDDDRGGGGGRDDDDDGPPRDDDDGPNPSPTRPGYGHGDKNHDHTGPPGLGKLPKPPKKGDEDDD
jgi:hypothetical protein